MNFRQIRPTRISLRLKSIRILKHLKTRSTENNAVWVNRDQLIQNYFPSMHLRSRQCTGSCPRVEAFQINFTKSYWAVVHMRIAANFRLNIRFRQQQDNRPK